MAGSRDINPVAERLTGWSEEEAIGRPIDEVFNIVNEETRAKAPNPVSRVLAEGVVVGLANHTALISRDGTERPIADSGAPIRDARGVTRGAVLVFRDVTEERRAEDALRQSEEKLRLMIASVSDYAIFMLDPQGRVASWNPGAERIKGYREEEILGVHFSRFFTPEDVADGKPAQELESAARAGEVRGRGLEGLQGRIALLGERRDHADARHLGPARRLRQDHARPDASAKIGRGAGEAGASAGGGPTPGRIPVDRLTRAQDAPHRSSIATARGAGQGIADRRGGRRRRSTARPGSAIAWPS